MRLPASDVRQDGQTPHVVVLLLNWNGWKDTIECLESVFALEYPRFTVIVCDNASGDDSLRRIGAWAAGHRRDGHGLRVLEMSRESAERGGVSSEPRADLVLIQTGGNLGFAGGNNVGMRYALRHDDCDLVWLLNNDTRVAPDTLSLLVQQLRKDTTLGAVGGMMLEFDTPDVIQEAGGTFSEWHGMVRTIGTGQRASTPQSYPAEREYITGGCVLVRAQVLHQVGLLDERFFMYAEDVDWSIRMVSAGYALGHAPLAMVWHKGGGSATHGSPFHDYLNVKSALLLIAKHYPARLPVAVAYSVYRCLLPKAARWQPARFTAVLRAYRDVIRQLREMRQSASSDERHSAGTLAQER